MMESLINENHRLKAPPREEVPRAVLAATPLWSSGADGAGARHRGAEPAGLRPAVALALCRAPQHSE